MDRRSRLRKKRRAGGRHHRAALSLIVPALALLCLILTGCAASDQPGGAGANGPATRANKPSIGTIEPTELLERIGAGETPLLIDVRRAEEFAEGHVPGAINIPHDALGDRLSELGSDRGREVVIYCRSGRRAGIAEQVMLEAGFTKVRDLQGHMLGWKAAGHPTE